MGGGGGTGTEASLVPGGRSLAPSFYRPAQSFKHQAAESLRVTRVCLRVSAFHLPEKGLFQLVLDSSHSDGNCMLACCRLFHVPRGWREIAVTAFR